ncbi:unnamed protein product [Auanema sp. JU1783]|nr:unnamed protein product [Auanema sp. JU1783]
MMNIIFLYAVHIIISKPNQPNSPTRRVCGGAQLCYRCTYNQGMRFGSPIALGAILLFSLLLLTFSSHFLFENIEQTTNKYKSNQVKLIKDDVQPITRSKYSGLPASDGLLFTVDRHYVRRRRRRSVDITQEDRRQEASVKGVARDCHKACHLRLRSVDGQSYKIHLHRFHQIAPSRNKTIPHIHNSDIVPLVQYFEGEDSVRAKLSRASPNCIYRARVVGSSDQSIVNLCDSDDGLYGLLALPNKGVYTVEPIVDENNASTTTSGRHKSHVAHQIRSHTFHHHFDDTNSTSTSESMELPIFDANSTSEQPLWEDLSFRSARSRRAANSWDHYVEVLVVTDVKMYEYHGFNLEDYVLTLFSTVASIYRHQSLRASINVVVVKIIILKHENQGPVVSSNAQETLQGFCKWQSLYNERNDESPTHHDVAILLTRGDICRAPGKCDTLGLAELGTMCDWQKSCAIIEDNGLSAAFTIAHELGHIFNIPHDDERRCSQFMHVTKSNYHIMAPTLEYNTHPWSWSECSSGMLEKFLDNNRGQIQCLFDQPVQRKYYEQLFESPPPGQKYDVNQQCKFVFGPQSGLCPYMPTCRRLWCATYYGTQMGCRTQHMPWADGTPCDKTDQPKYCHRGECVDMSPDRRSRTDGGWGEWQTWGQCSRTCGGGIQKALRDCDNPRPSNGGKYCVGLREQYKSCNTQECPWDTPGFREVQCAEFNNKDVGIHGVSSSSVWVPKYSGVASNERCKLFCRISGTAAAYLLRDKVADGTPCDRNGDDICVDGTCMKAGCDHILQSNVRRDRCGICGGDDTSCRVVKGTYNERGSFGYNEVMKIPAGSANIDIRQHGYKNQKDDDNYLSLRAANGEFLLNGHFQVSVFRQHIPIQDVVLEYSGSDNVVERINGTGPIRSDIYVHVLSVGNLYPPDISYEYMTAVETKRRPPVHGFFWRHGDRWSECDRTCQGSQRQDIYCVDAMTNKQSGDRNCKTRKPDHNTRMCNIDCTIKWHTEDISRCSAQCGAGEKRLRVLCVRLDSNGRSNPARETDCDRNTRPSERASCYTDCSGRRWAYTEWTPCSVTCGSGVSTRNASCLDDRGRRIDETLCGLQTEKLMRNCVQHPCPRWVYGHWSECSRSCDGGVRMRHAQCLDAADRETDPRRCEPKHDREKCNEHLCTNWSFGQWTACSVTCGVGIQTREAKCVDRENRLLDNGKCNYRERIVQKPCNRPSCPTWKIGEWTTCSVSCQDGWSTRRVTCADYRGQDVPTEQCQQAGDRPSSHKPCNQGPCPFWRSGDWSSCSVSCGSGVRQRTSECVYRDQVVDQSFCGETKAPERSQQCSLVPCSNWEMTPWTSCSVTCGSGVQTREVFCASGAMRERMHDQMCDKKLKPRNQKVCERDSCSSKPVYVVAPLSEVPTIRWATGPWTPCSTSCDAGQQKRLVKCRDQVRDLPDEYCRHIEKPDDQQTCQLKACAYWRSGPWQPCSATCGSHVQQSRTVQCVAYNSKQNVSETDCDVAHRPTAVKSCKLEACPQGEPPLGRWRTGDWEKCTKTCGGGWRRRAVSCSAGACDETTKPRSLDSCNSHVCPVSNNTWQISPWTHCSVTCGGGVQRRRVWCEDATTFVSKEDVDCGDKKPIEQRDCELAPCPPRLEPVTPLRPEWQTSPWSSCSVKCGRGVRRRLVACVDTTTNAAISTSLCDKKKKPLEEHKCRVMHCPRWRGMPWGPCSSTCGAGVRRREVFCQRGRRQRTNETECSSATKPPTEAKCYQPACPAYNWVTTPWSKCLDPCAKNQQHRRVYCMSNGGKRAAPRMCNTEKTPPTTRQCDFSRCPYEWAPGPWQTCSKTCGNGTQSRSIECLVKSSQTSNLLSEHSVPKGKCEALPMPKDQQDCNLNACEAEYQWQIGPWQACSKTCGHGVRRRKVRCFHRNGTRVAKQNCEAVSVRPRRTQTCFERNCLPSTCQEIRSQAKTPSTDGNYTVLLDGFPILVYCHRMNETIPGTYINIHPDSNFAEVYGKRLIYPHTCPYNGDRNDSCQCSEYGDAHAGFTRFSKIRVDLLNRKIKINDFTFAKTINGSHVEYATAGDCYSMKDCPQGRFSVDLVGTGLRIVDDLQWEDKGHRTTSRIDRTSNNARVEGRCGGYCGKCSPDKYKGLVFEIDTKQVQPFV